MHVNNRKVYCNVIFLALMLKWLNERPVHEVNYGFSKVFCKGRPSLCRKGKKRGRKK